MGNLQAGLDYKLHQNVVPHPGDKSKFDPLTGFENGREEKVMIATDEEMYAAKIPHKNRTYCAHLLIKYKACRRDNFPWIYKCHHEKHEYENCEYAEFVDRMKDYERERRLMERENKLKATAG